MSRYSHRGYEHRTGSYGRRRRKASGFRKKSGGSAAAKGAAALVTAAGGAALALMGHSLPAIALSLLSIADTEWLYRGICPKEE